MSFVRAPEAPEDGGKPTQHTDEKGLVNQLVALRVDQVELEGQAASRLPLFMAVLQQTYGGEAGGVTEPGFTPKEHLIKDKQTPVGRYLN